MSQSRMAVITFIDGGPVDPGFGVGGGYPSQGLPGYGGGYPSHPINIPPPGSVGQLPVFPFDPTEKPDQDLPEGGSPDQSLPGGGEKPEQPIQIKPGAKFVIKWLCGVGLILVPQPK
jgi:hypothetical protein